MGGGGYFLGPLTLTFFFLLRHPLLHLSQYDGVDTCLGMGARGAKMSPDPPSPYFLSPSVPMHGALICVTLCLSLVDTDSLEVNSYEYLKNTLPTIIQSLESSHGPWASCFRIAGGLMSMSSWNSPR